MIALFFVAVSITTISCLASNQTISARDLIYITEQYPPYNFQEDGVLQGISVDLLENVWEKMNVSLNRSVIKLLPWADGYQRALSEKNTVLFAIDRSPDREKLFKWAGPIGIDRTVLYAKADRDINISSSQDLKKYKIGAIEEDRALQMLLDEGMKKGDLVLERAPKPIIEMLRNGSIDAWAYGDITGIWLIQQSGENASDYSVAYVLGENNVYYAFNKETPDYLVQSFQQALDYIKSNKDSSGISDYEKILYEYIPAIKTYMRKSQI